MFARLTCLLTKVRLTCRGIAKEMFEVKIGCKGFFIFFCNYILDKDLYKVVYNHIVLMKIAYTYYTILCEQIIYVILAFIKIGLTIRNSHTNFHPLFQPLLPFLRSKVFCVLFQVQFYLRNQFHKNRFSGLGVIA